MFDITNDMDLSFLSQALHDAPIKPVELIKQANVNIDYSQLPNDIFADPVEKKFPIHTPADAAISALYIYKQASEVDEDVKQRVANALEEYGLKELEPLLEGEKEMVKIASEEHFLLPSKLKFPALDPDMLLKSASAAETYFHVMPLSDKVELATNLVKTAEEFNIEPEKLPKWAFVYGQHAPCNLEKLAHELGVRYAYTKHEGYQDLFQELKGLFKTAGEISFDAGTNRSIVAKLIKLDKQANISYDELPDPFIIVFNEIDAQPEEISKTASDELVTIGGVDFYKDDLAELIMSSDGPAIIGEDLYKAAEEHYNVLDADAVISELQSLPKEAQELIAEYLVQYINE